MRWIAVVLSALLSACQPVPIPAYDFDAVFHGIKAIDTRHGASFFNETMDDPLDDQTIEAVREELAIVRKNNDLLRDSADHHAISLFLDSREWLLISQQRFSVFSEHFVGGWRCETLESDLYYLSILDEAVSHGIRASSRLDKLLTESVPAREIILALEKPALYETNYGYYSLFSEEYAFSMSERCAS